MYFFVLFLSFINVLFYIFRISVIICVMKLNIVLFLYSLTLEIGVDTIQRHFYRQRIHKHYNITGRCYFVLEH